MLPEVIEARPKTLGHVERERRCESAQEFTGAKLLGWPYVPIFRRFIRC